MQQRTEPAGPGAGLGARPCCAPSADPAGAAPTASAQNSASPCADPAAEAVLQQHMIRAGPGSAQQGPAQGNVPPENLAGSISAPAADLDLRGPWQRPQNADPPAGGPARAREPGKPSSGLDSGCAPLCAAQTRPAAGSQPHATAGGLDPGDPLLRPAQEALSAQLAAAKLRLEAELREKRKAFSVRPHTGPLLPPTVAVA